MRLLAAFALFALFVSPAVAAPKAARAHAAKAPGESEALPCPRAAYKDDPVCFDAPDGQTLPTPSTHGREAAPREAGAFQPADAENLSVGMKWGANNNSTSRETTPLRSVGAARRSVDEKDDWGGGGGATHLGAGVNLKF
jgi:hypothetical protein